MVPWCLPSAELKGQLSNIGKKSSLWPLLLTLKGPPGWASASLVGRDSLGWPGWFCFRKMWWFQETNVTDPVPQTHCNWTWSPWDAQQVLPKHGAFCTADGGGTHSPGSPKAAQIASLCYLPVCSSGATAGADAGISAEALILFILQPKLGHQCCQEACFFGLMHGECIFNAISAVLYHWTPMCCVTAVRALQ